VSIHAPAFLKSHAGQHVELEAEIARLSQNVTPGSAQRPSAEPSAPLPSRLRTRARRLDARRLECAAPSLAAGGPFGRAELGIALRSDGGDGSEGGEGDDSSLPARNASAPVLVEFLREFASVERASRGAT
jgi:hypothetical protein